MHYIVTARVKPGTAGELLSRLSDGSIARQKPDGAEIVAAMQRAVVDEAGVARWSEVCYCDTPLAHERETVYDRHFEELTTEEVDGYVEFEGRPLVELLQELAQ